MRHTGLLKHAITLLVLNRNISNTYFLVLLSRFICISTLASLVFFLHLCYDSAVTGHLAKAHLDSFCWGKYETFLSCNQN